MKKIAFFLSTIFILTACTSNSGTPSVVFDETPDFESPPVYSPGEIPFDFPAILTTTALAEESVYAPTKDAIEKAFKLGGEGSVLIFEKGKMIEPGEKESLVQDLSGAKNPIPNSLIIAIPQELELAANTTIITGAEMEKVFVSETNIESFTSGTYFPLPEILTIGAQTAFKHNDKYNHGTIINISEGKALITGFAGAIYVKPLSDLTLIPASLEVEIGDTIQVPVIGTYQEATVTEVHPEFGQVVAQYTWLDETITDSFIFGEITKKL